MTIKYKCYRCNNYETALFNDIKKHVSRKNPCKKNGKNILLSDDQLLCLTLIPYNNNIHDVELSEIEHLQMSNIIDKNKSLLIKELDNIDKNKIKNCKYCNENFCLMTKMKKHFILHCFHDHILENDKKININISNDNINNVYNQCNITNNNTNTTTNNNFTTNIYVEIKSPTPIPFDNNWDISQISDAERTDIMVSKMVYENFLTEILKNEINLNVIMDKEKGSGMVYKNDEEKYIQMKSKDIVENTMDKLNVYLNEFNKNNTKTHKDIIDYSRRIFNKNYIDFGKNKEVNIKYNNSISDIFNEKKEEALKIAKNVVV